MSVKAGIIVFPGTNCEVDTKRACEFFGWKSEFIWHDEKIQKKYDVIFLAGGFSFGDHISSGRIAKLSPAVKTLPVGDALIVGICNGFQILCEAGLLSGYLTHNQNLKFISKLAELNFLGQKIKLPIAHHQGNYQGFNSAENEIILSYIKNENGSEKNIAGVYDRQKKIIAMMPHPERAVFEELGNIDGRKVFEFIA